MNRAALKRIPLKPDYFAGWSRKIHLATLALFVCQFIFVWLALWPQLGIRSQGRWPDGLLLVLATAATLASASRQLPGQNVMLASVIIACIAGTSQAIGALTGVPFGPYVYTANIGQLLFYPLPWAVPFLWIILILNARGVARLVLRPWRKTRAYGFWVIGVATALVVTAVAGLEPFATRVKHFWFWNPTKGGLEWYTAPWVNFIGWAMTTLVILAFATPSLINKKPVKHPPDYQPLILWLMVNMLFATGAAAQHLWPALAVIVSTNVTAAIFAIRGARW